MKQSEMLNSILILLICVLCLVVNAISLWIEERNENRKAKKPTETILVEKGGHLWVMTIDHAQQTCTKSQIF